MLPYSLGLAGSANDGYVNEEELCLPKMKHNLFESWEIFYVLDYLQLKYKSLKGFTHEINLMIYFTIHIYKFILPTFNKDVTNRLTLIKLNFSLL